ncbi:MAG: hypothetical protein OXN89_02425 [Bryobacterales bacterium]|nr:hypothetical protein [Bryobacterales bacterium]
MSRRGREGAPSDDVLLQALDQLVAAEGIVEAGDLLGVNYRTAAKCLEERHVSRRMRQALEKYLREQTEETEQEKHEDQATTPRPDEPAPGEQGGGEEARLQEPGEDWRRAVEELRVELALLRERVEAVECHVSRGPDDGGGGVDVDDVDAGQGVEQPRSVVPPRRVFPELITEHPEPGEEQVYGAAAEEVIEWRESWAARKRSRLTLDWLRAERRRLELELRLIGVFDLTPPPADAPWGERRRERELDWRRRALRRMRWQLPLTWCLHWLLRGLTLGLWGRTRER